MKVILVAAMALITFSQKKCSRQKVMKDTACYKGRLEIKGIRCKDTIKLWEGGMDSTKITAAWKDNVTQQTYTNVFALGSRCTFPSAINAGDEFYFTLDDTVQNCMVCMAYYPHPPRALRIKIITGPCQ